jgi:hypothetical protein
VVKTLVQHQAYISSNMPQVADTFTTYLQSYAIPYVLNPQRMQLIRSAIDGAGLPGTTWTPTYNGNYVISVVLTGSVQGTVSYFYNGSNQVISAVVSLTYPWTIAYTESYTYSGSLVTSVIGSTITGA